MAESDGILSSIWGAVDDACATAISAVAERAKALAVFHGALGNDAKAEFSNIQREDRSVGRKRMSLPHKGEPIPSIKRRKQTSTAVSDRAAFSAAVYFEPESPTDHFCPTYDFRRMLCEAHKENAPDEEQEVLGDTAPRILYDLGLGYDQSDSFLDFEETIVDHVIPRGWTTRHGGFYIGTGKLYIRPAEPCEVTTSVYRFGTIKECKSAKKLLQNNLKSKRKVIKDNVEPEEVSLEV